MRGLFRGLETGRSLEQEVRPRGRELQQNFDVAQRSSVHVVEERKDVGQQMQLLAILLFQIVRKKIKCSDALVCRHIVRNSNAP